MLSKGLLRMGWIDPVTCLYLLNCFQGRGTKLNTTVDKVVLNKVVVILVLVLFTVDKWFDQGCILQDVVVAYLVSMYSHIVLFGYMSVSV